MNYIVAENVGKMLNSGNQTEKQNDCQGRSSNEMEWFLTTLKTWKYPGLGLAQGFLVSDSDLNPNKWNLSFTAVKDQKYSKLSATNF